MIHESHMSHVLSYSFVFGIFSICGLRIEFSFSVYRAYSSSLGTPFSFMSFRISYLAFYHKTVSSDVKMYTVNPRMLSMIRVSHSPIY